MIKLLKRIVCLFLGHDVVRITYTNEYHINTNRKGGKKRGSGIKRYKSTHKRYFCYRCGKKFKKNPYRNEDNIRY